MATTLNTPAVEGSTYIVTTAAVNEDGDAVTFKTFAWTLTDVDGTVINTTTVATPGASVSVVLTGTDLALQSGESGETVRVLTVEGTYDSDAGTSLPIKGACKFVLEDLVAV